MFVDIVLIFFTGHQGNELQMEMWPVWQRYFLSYFLFDFLAVIPGLVTAEFFH
jgi:hypothetical protein